jgi:hypothetical protein
LIQQRANWWPIKERVACGSHNNKSSNWKNTLFGTGPYFIIMVATNYLLSKRLAISVGGVTVHHNLSNEHDYMESYTKLSSSFAIALDTIHSKY